MHMWTRYSELSVPGDQADQFSWLVCPTEDPLTLALSPGERGELRGKQLGDHRVGFDLYEYLGRNQAAHLHHAGGRPDVAEEFPVGLAALFPVVNVGDVHAGPDHVLETGAGPAQRRLDVPQGLD